MRNFTIARIVRTRNFLPLLMLLFSLPVFQLSAQNCSIRIVITDITCNDNGTSLDADDDTYSFNMTVVGTNASAQWEGSFGSVYLGMAAFGPTNYGDVLPFGLLAAGDFTPTNVSPPTVVAGGQDVEIAVNDVANPNCRTTITVSSPGTCSQVAVPTCDITGSFIVTDGCLTDQFTVLVDANDPYNPPNNTRYSYDYDIASDNTIAGISTSDPRGLNLRYGTPGIKTITATLRENANPACKQTFTTSFNVIDCNVSECLVGMDISNILCSDAGTPYDASDDTYTFNVEVFRTGGTDPSGGYELDVSNGNLGAFLLPGNYGDIHLVGPFPVGFDIDLVARTNGTPSCADFQTVTSPAACSTQQECSIGFDVTNIKCNDNGTPSDAADDFFTFNLFVSRTGGTSGNGWIANYDNANLGAFIETGAYNELILVGPFPVGNDINITVSSDGTPSCSASAVAVSPAACSNAPACSIAGTFSVADGCLSDEYRLFVDANDPYFPPNNPRYIYDYNIAEANTIAFANSIDPRDVNVTFATPGIKNITAKVTDRNNPTCVQTFTTSFVVMDCGIEGPETCLVDIDISNNVCQDNGMFTFDLTVFRTAGAPGDTYEGTEFFDDIALAFTGTYNQTITLGPYPILEESQLAPFNSFRRTVSVAVNAIGVTGCSDFVEVLAPESCPVTPACSIAGIFSVADGCLSDEYRLFVDANDPYNPPNNPRYIYDYNLGADNTIAGASSVDPRSVNVRYSTPGTKTMTATVTDRNDPTCVLTLTTSFVVRDCGIEGPETCLVDIDISNNVCQDNGMFTFDLAVFRTGDTPDAPWEGTLGTGDTGIPITGTYNERMTMGPFTVLEQDMTNPLNSFRRTVRIAINAAGIPTCDDFVEVLAPESCPVTPACSIAGIFSVADGCLSDEFRLFVDANDPYNPPNNPRYIYDYNLGADNTISGASSVDPRSVNVTYSTPGTKTITATVTDRNDRTCVQTFTTSFVVRDCGIEGPESCLVAIDISNNVCQDNGMFTFDLTVFRTAGAPGDTYEGTEFFDDIALAFTGTYNQTITLGPYPILEESQLAPFNSFRRTVSVAVNAIGVAGCSDFVEVLAPESCPVAPACTLAGTFSVANGCLSEEFRLFVDANDPYNPPNNPRYIYDYNLGADNTISGASSVDPRSVNVTYSTPGTKTITATVTDRNDPTCVLTLTTSFVVTDCNNVNQEPCVVSIDISNNVCRDNGTFTFDLTVFRTGGTPGSTWEGSVSTDDTGFLLTGTYNEPMTMGPYPALQQRMTDPLNLFRRRVLVNVNAMGIRTCDDFAEVLAPDPCGTPPIPAGGIDYCANVSVVGGPGQIRVNRVNAPIHRIQYRIYPSSPYTDICVNNCFESQLIYGLGANTYYIRVEQSSADGSDFCEQEYTVEVSPTLTASSSRAAAFTEFNAYQEARQVDLEWLTNTTYKSDYFLIEKSIDGLTFETLASVDNKPVGLDVGYFQSIDLIPTMGDNYYRLKQVYQDGTFAYSAVRHIRFGIDITSMDLYPNPAKQELYVNLTEYEGKQASVLIANQYGTVVEQYQVAAISKEPMRIDLAAYSNGLYFIRTKISKTKIITKKFLVNKLY